MHSAGVFHFFFEWCAFSFGCYARSSGKIRREGLFVWWVRSARPTIERNSFRAALIEWLDMIWMGCQAGEEETIHLL
jgi:hypothetical protein